MPTIVLYKNIYSHFIHTSQKLEIIQISINKRSEKDLIVYSYNRTLFSNEKNKLDLHNYEDEFQKPNIILNERS